jgi:hypothetical protein
MQRDDTGLDGQKHTVIELSCPMCGELVSVAMSVRDKEVHVPNVASSYTFEGETFCSHDHKVYGALVVTGGVWM